KGTIAPGSDADIVLFDPNKERTISVDTHHMNVDYSALEGMKVTGEPVTVLSRGEYVIKDKQLVGKPGMGKFLKCDKFDANAQAAVEEAGDLVKELACKLRYKLTDSYLIHIGRLYKTAIHEKGMDTGDGKAS